MTGGPVKVNPGYRARPELCSTRLPRRADLAFNGAVMTKTYKHTHTFASIFRHSGFHFKNISVAPTFRFHQFSKVASAENAINLDLKESLGRKVLAQECVLLFSFPCLHSNTSQGKPLLKLQHLNSLYDDTLSIVCAYNHQTKGGDPGVGVQPLTFDFLIINWKGLISAFK